MISEAALQLAVDLAAWFVRTGYPYLGKPTVDLDGPFPLVTVWDDEVAVMLVVACTESVHYVHEALAFADRSADVLEEVDSGAAVTGAIGVVLHNGFFYVQIDNVISSRPIKHILGGE